MQPYFSVLMISVAFGLVTQGPVAIAQSVPLKGKADPSLSPKPASSKKNAAKTTFVEVELLQEADASGVFAQHWLKALESLDVPLRMHRASPKEKPEIKERSVGHLRYVTAIGRINGSGKMVFPDRTFGIGDTTKLKEWIEELRTYGAQGIPAGQPLWGLTKEQFTSVFESISKPIELQTEQLPLSQLILKLQPDYQFPIRWSEVSASGTQRDGTGLKARQEMHGFSMATTLAVTLRDHGLAFRPNRTPSAEVELLIEPRNPAVEQWPVGWPLQRQKLKAAPKFFALVPIELSDLPLADVLNAAEIVSETPILIDYSELSARQIDPAKIKVSFPAKKSNWSIALNRMIVPHGLVHELWQDEAGRCFVWITTARAARAKDLEKDAIEP